MAYYDTAYGGWIPKNTSYQGTYLGQKWTRPYPGHNDTATRGSWSDRGDGANDTNKLSQSGCRQWNWAGGWHGGKGMWKGDDSGEIIILEHLGGKEPMVEALRIIIQQIRLFKVLVERQRGVIEVLR